MNLFLISLIILGCEGYVMSMDPLCADSNWKCLKCNCEMLASDVLAEQEDWEDRIENAPKNIMDQRQLLDQLLKLYHPNHNMCVDVYYNMVPLFGHSGSKENLIIEAEAKLEMVNKCFSIMDKVHFFL